ncbi:hypothetical protein [Streptomyces sp. HPF1205]|uniref:hypothetical protein n=1 Tax=Streptomyces sp. HPF1205 TaxID=2873262 RepID=UPI001CEC5F48|nr:hypothetical protein [Streptomyces sp. HPF1205]
MESWNHTAQPLRHRRSQRGGRHTLAADATRTLTGFPGPLAHLINTVLATGHRILLTPPPAPPPSHTT